MGFAIYYMIHRLFDRIRLSNRNSLNSKHCYIISDAGRTNISDSQSLGLKVFLKARMKETQLDVSQGNMV